MPEMPDVRKAGAAPPLAVTWLLDRDHLQNAKGSVLSEPGYEAVRLHARRRLRLALGEFRYLISKQSGVSGLSAKQKRAKKTHCYAAMLTEVQVSASIPSCAVHAAGMPFPSPDTGQNTLDSGGRM